LTPVRAPAGMTTSEKLSAMEQYRFITSCASKYDSYENMAQNSELKQLITESAQMLRSHASRLQSSLGESGVQI